MLDGETVFDNNEVVAFMSQSSDSGVWIYSLKMINNKSHDIIDDDLTVKK